MPSSPSCWTRRALAAACLLAAFAAQAAPAALATAQTASAAAAAAQQPLTVKFVDATAGDETPRGRMISDPAGIDCPTKCEALFDEGAAVTLRASPDAGYALVEWSTFPNDPACAQTARCSVTIPGTPIGVTATFQPAALLSVFPSGPGTMSISPVSGAAEACLSDGQQLQGTCEQRYLTGDRATIKAQPNAGATFLGWSDFECKKASRSCTLPITGQRYLSALFGPVTLSIQRGDYGAVRVSPQPGGLCTLMEGTPPCKVTFKSGTTVTLRRSSPQQPAPGRFWIGACQGNVGGELDGGVCKLQLNANELVGAGLESAEAIPPGAGSGFSVQLSSRKRGKVTGKVDGRPQTLSCGTRCSLSNLKRYDVIRVRATAFKGSRFLRWNDGNKQNPRPLPLTKFTRIQAIFGAR